MNFKHTLLLFTALCATGSAKADYSEFKDFMLEKTYNEGAFLGKDRDALINALRGVLFRLYHLKKISFARTEDDIPYGFLFYSFHKKIEKIPEIKSLDPKDIGFKFGGFIWDCLYAFSSHSYYSNILPYKDININIFQKYFSILKRVSDKEFYPHLISALNELASQLDVVIRGLEESNTYAEFKNFVWDNFYTPAGYIRRN